MAEIDRVLRELIEQILRERLPLWDWVSARQAGELLDISEEAVRHRVLRGSLPGVKHGGRVYLRRSDLDSLLSAADN